MDLIKFEFFCTAKVSTGKMERQSTEREKIFANDMIDKRLILNVYKQLTQLNIEKKPTKPKKLIKKWTEDPNRHFSKEDMQMAN